MSTSRDKIKQSIGLILAPTPRDKKVCREKRLLNSWSAMWTKPLALHCKILYFQSINQFFI